MRGHWLERERWKQYFSFVAEELDEELYFPHSLLVIGPWRVEQTAEVDHRRLQISGFRCFLQVPEGKASFPTELLLKIKRTVSIIKNKKSRRKQAGCGQKNLESLQE